MGNGVRGHKHPRHPHRPLSPLLPSPESISAISFKFSAWECWGLRIFMFKISCFSCFLKYKKAEISKAEITGSSGLKSVTTVCGFHQLRTSTWWVKNDFCNTVHMHFWKKKYITDSQYIIDDLHTNSKKLNKKKSCFQCSRNVHQILSF